MQPRQLLLVPVFASLVLLNGCDSATDPDSYYRLQVTHPSGPLHDLGGGLVRVVVSPGKGLQAVTASIGTEPAELTLTPDGYWEGHIPETTYLQPGKYTLEVEAYGTKDRRGKTSAEVAVLEGPEVRLLAPRDPYDILTPDRTVRATCLDRHYDVCGEIRIEVYRYQSETWHWETVASIANANSLEEAVPWEALGISFGGTAIRVTASSVTGTPARRPSRQLEVPLISTDGLTVLDSVAGRITDYDGDRILARICGPWPEGCQEERLQITRRSGGSTLSPPLPYAAYSRPSYTRTYSADATVLTSVGAMTTFPTGVDFAADHFVNMGSIRNLRVGGPVAYFQHEGKGLLRDHREDHDSHLWTRTLAPGSMSGDAGSDGAVLFDSPAGIIHLRDEQRDSFPGRAVVTAVEGGTIAFLRPLGDVQFESAEVVIVMDGVETVLDTVVPGFYPVMEASDGWVAFGEGVHPYELRLRTPSGSFALIGHGQMVALAADGRVLYGPHGTTELRLYDPATHTSRLLVADFDAAGFVGPVVWVAVGRFLFTAN